MDKWVEAQSCANFASCERQLAWSVQTQRERYRIDGEQTRIQKHPDLYANPRGYESEQDGLLWSRQRVRAYLAGFRFQRKVEKYGQVTLFANTYSAGRAYARQYIEIYFDELTDQWVLLDETEQEIRRHPAKELTYEQISQLMLAKRRKN